MVSVSASAAILRPGELLQVADGKYREAALIGRLGVRDYINNHSFRHLLLLTNGTLATSTPNPPVTTNIAALVNGDGFGDFVWLIQDSGRAVRWGTAAYPLLI